MTAPTLAIRNLDKRFGGGRTIFGREKPAVHAVQDASLDVPRGETLGIVGESGCGKSTLARMIVGLLPPTGGTIEIEGTDYAKVAGKDPAAFGKVIQYVFQDPISSLNPRKTIRQILEAPLKLLHGMPAARRAERIDEILDAVNLRREFLDRYPHEFSGGQAQRIGVARALAAAPRILVLDEPVSALEIFAHPRHHYTALLARSAPTVGRPLSAPEGVDAELPDPLDPPPGCAFAKRCPAATDICRTVRPEFTDHGPGHYAACHHPAR